MLYGKRFYSAVKMEQNSLIVLLTINMHIEQVFVLQTKTSFTNVDLNIVHSILHIMETFQLNPFS